MMGMGGKMGGGGGAAATPGLPTIPGSGGGPSQETIWWYKYPQQGLFYAFLLNKQGQVIQIQAHGYKPDPKAPTARTAKGITLGAPFGAILKDYGWSSDGEHVGEYLVMRYDSREQIGGGHGRLAFQLMRNQVVESRSDTSSSGYVPAAESGTRARKRRRSVRCVREWPRCAAWA